MLDFFRDMSISSSLSLILHWTDLYWVEFADISRLKYELKAKHARQLQRPKQMPLSIATVVIRAVVFWESGLHAQWRNALPIREIWSSADTKSNWFFKMAANKGDLTTNLKKIFRTFSLPKAVFIWAKLVWKEKKIRYLFKFWSVTFDP